MNKQLAEESTWIINDHKLKFASDEGVQITPQWDPLHTDQIDIFSKFNYMIS